MPQPMKALIGSDKRFVTELGEPLGVVTSDAVIKIAVLTQAQHDVLVAAGTVDVNTQYNIVEN